MAVDFNLLEKQYGLPTGLLDAVTHREDASGDPTAVSPKGAVGTFQFMPETAKAYGIDPTDPEQSADGAARMFADLHKQYKGDLPKMLAAYNWGSGNLDKNGLEKAPTETRKYIGNVIDRLNKNGTSKLGAGTQVADLSGTIGAPTDEPDQMAPDDLELKKKQAIAVAKAKLKLQEQTQQPAQKTEVGNLEGLANRLNNTVDYGIKSASDVMGPIAGMLTGKEYKDQVPTPDLDTLGKKGFHDTSWPEIAGAVEESLMASPPGKMLGMLAATPPGMALGAGLGKANEMAEEHLGMPHQYSQALEMMLPFAGKARGMGTEDIMGAPPGSGGPRGMLPAATDTVSGLKAQLKSLPLVQGTKNFVEDLMNPPQNAAAPNPAAAAAPSSPPQVPASLSLGAAGQPLLVSPKAMGRSEDILRQVLADENIKPEDVATNLEQGLQTGKPLTALDVATKDVGGVMTQGKQLMALAKAAANLPGQGASMAGEVAARGLKASDRIGEDFDKSISNAPFYNVKEDAIQTQQGSGPLYQEAYKANQDVMSPEIKAILNTPAGRQALKNAVTTMQNNRQMVGVNNPDLVEQAALTGDYEPGAGGIATGLKLKTLDLVKQELWDLAESKRNATTGRNTTESRAIKEQMASLTNELDKLDTTNKVNRATKEIEPGSGLYSQGRKTYSTGARQEAAAEQGREFMSMDPEEIQKFIEDKNTSDPEKLAFASGVRRALQDKIDATNDGSNPINKIWKQNIRSRIRPLFPDEASYNAFLKNMEHEQAIARTNSNYHAGSPTAPNLQYAGMMGAPAKAIKGLTNPGGAAADFGIELLNKKLQKAAKNMDHETAAGIIRYLTTNDPEVWRYLANTNP